MKMYRIIAVISLCLASHAYAADAIRVENGNVGINNDTPTEQLDVVGDIKSTSDIISHTDVHRLTVFNNISPNYLFKNVGGVGTPTMAFKALDANNNDTEGVVYFGYDQAKVTLRAKAYLDYSDSRIKEDVRNVEGALRKINNLNGVTYRYKHGLRNTTHGVIAQEVMLEFPELVEADEEGILAVNYSGLIAPLIESVKELTARVEYLEEELSKK